MAQEKVMIIEMIKDKTITVNDGVRLLNALSSSSLQNPFNKIKSKVSNLIENDALDFVGNTKKLVKNIKDNSKSIKNDMFNNQSKFDQEFN